MKKVSKILLIALSLALVLSVYACADKPAESSAPPSGNDVSQTPAAEPDDSSQSPDAEPPENTGSAEDNAPSLEGGTLVMATNAAFPPYEYYEGSEIVGIDAEIAAAIAEKLGMTLRIDDMDFDAIIIAVSSGKADMGMAGMTVTDERKQSVDFSSSYATGVQVVIVGEGSPITSVDDLFGDANYSIGVQEATTGDLYTTWDLEDEGLASISRYKKGADAIAALSTGKVDCVVIDNEPAKAFVAANPGLVILDTEYAIEDYAIAFAKNSPLTEPVDKALLELIDEGVVQAIIDKYIPAE